MQTVEAKGFKIPIVGLGTWALRGRDCARLTEQAIRIGYRHIDTAQMYDNEREVGEGVRASGLRAEVMVTTKVQPTMLAPHDLERSVKESLARLRLDVIDLLLIHWPNPRVPLAETLGAMAKMKREGYSVFQWSDRPQATYALHKHERDQSHWIISGAFELTIETVGTFVLRSGDRDFMPAGTYHSARVVSSEPIVYLIGEKI